MLAVGCSNHLNITIKSNSELNNGGNPVVLRIYFLKTDKSFKTAPTNLVGFWEDDKKVLSKDLIHEPMELVLYPDEIRKMKKIKLAKEINFVGVAADFYKPDQIRWRYIFDLSEKKYNEVILTVGRDKLSIIPLTQ